jgi:carbamate kinase
VTTVVALGGHLLAGGALGEVRGAIEQLAGDGLVLTHGNGPQVGEELARSPGLPVHVAVARTQAEIGSAVGLAVGAACLVTHVVVDPDDPAFGDPAKPIGPWLPEHPGGDAIHDDERGWRRVIASPRPLDIVELAAIQALAERGGPVVCCGGGGIPVADGEGVAAVIDKDRVSAMLAERLGAGRLVLLTDVDAVYRNFRSAGEQRIEELTAAEAEALAPELPLGSMGPKLESCAAFVRATRGAALITSARALEAALGARAGTWVRP